MSEIVLMDGAALSGAIRSRQLSCVEVMTAYLNHIDRFNPRVNAIVALQERTGLLAEAQQRDEALKQGRSLGALHGIPHAVKDLQPVRGIRSTQGSALFKDFVPSADSLMVERLRAAGAIFIGKTNSPEFGLGSHTYNPVYGTTRNAYELSRSAGGSSGGAAVALALRMVPYADGSDYGGSLRNPAGWNNVFGFRTSIGRVPVDAQDAWLPSIGVAGPMARTVTDLALLLSVQAGYDARVPLSIDGDGAPFRARLEADLKGKRIAWGADFKGYTPCEPGVLDVCRSAQGGGLLALYQDPAKHALLKPEAIYEIETGLQLSAYDISAASVVRTEWYQAIRKFFERYDYFIVPTAQVFPFPQEWHWPQDIAGTKMQTYHEWMKAALLISMSGCPALAAPAGFNPQGLPMGIQIVGPVRHELGCLQLAYAYESASSWIHARRPPMLSTL
jgi:amidase